MKSRPQPAPRWLVVFGLACVVVIAVEAYVVFVDREHTFSIEGERAYEVRDFEQGRMVSQAFLMPGDGLHAVRVRFSSDAFGTVGMKWTLYRGSPDMAASLTRAFENTESFDLRPGRQWKTLAFARDGSSDGRWYTIELQLQGTGSNPRPSVAIVASQDNPDRGGVLWVNGIRQPGSLMLRAERRGRTLYRRFMADAAPNLPAVLQIRAVQWGIAALFHWSLIVFAYGILLDGSPRAHSPGAK